MALSFFLHESLHGSYELIDRGSGETTDGQKSGSDEFPLVREKLTIPVVDGLVDRPRLNMLLSRSSVQFPATLISGRAGTGKTAIAARFAANTQCAWYTVEATDIEWPVFARYFSAALSKIDYADLGGDTAAPGSDASQSGIARFLLRHFFRNEVNGAADRSLIVLDDIHHIFDAPWFEEFFYLLLYSLPREAHLLMLCRSKPPAPMMRLRSKQMLNLVEEKVIAFDARETEELFDSRGLPASKAERARRDSFGRISRLLQIAA